MTPRRSPLSGGLELLARDPSQWAALAADPDLVNNAADEIIRYTSPVRHFMRYAQSDTRIGGVEIPTGGRVLLSYPSANRDEAVFDDPDRFNITRPDADKLLSFGVGAHFASVPSSPGESSAPCCCGSARNLTTSS